MPREFQPRILDTILSETEEFGIGIFDPSTQIIYRGNCLRISASFLYGGIGCVRVYEVGPLPESTNFRLVGQLDIMGPAVTWLFGDRVLVELCPRENQNHGYLVWDPTQKLVTDKFALSGRHFVPRWHGLCWSAEGDSLFSFQRESREDQYEGGTVLLGWKIPDLSEVGNRPPPLDGRETVKLEPYLRLRFNDGDMSSLRRDYRTPQQMIVASPESSRAPILHISFRSPECTQGSFLLYRLALEDDIAAAPTHSTRKTVKLLSRHSLRNPHMLETSIYRGHSSSGDHLTSIVEARGGFFTSSNISKINLIHHQDSPDEGGVSCGHGFIQAAGYTRTPENPL